MARGLKFLIWEVEELHNPCCENKGADQLRGYCEADLRLCFEYAKSQFSHDVAQIIRINVHYLHVTKSGSLITVAKIVSMFGNFMLSHSIHKCT